MLIIITFNQKIEVSRDFKNKRNILNNIYLCNIYKVYIKNNILKLYNNYI